MSSRILLCSLLFWVVVETKAQVDWPGLASSSLVTNRFDLITDIANAGDGSGRLFVVERPGLISIIQDTNLLPNRFLDIRDRVKTVDEGGLLGVCFSPGYSTNGWFYVFYTTNSGNNVVLSRFSVSPTNANLADATSEQVLIVRPAGSGLLHVGGKIAFGPDRLLYFWAARSTGNLTQLLGEEILRIDPESGEIPFSIPTNNPFYSLGGDAAMAWGIGLRNPWRFSFDRETGDFYVGDVGQSSFEEISFLSAGATNIPNFGWPIMEGPSNRITSADTNLLIPPVAWYSHASSLQEAVVGGFVYRGPSQTRLNGMYFFGDYGSARIFGLKKDGEAWRQRMLLSGSGGVIFLSTFGEAEDGTLLLARGSVSGTWAISKLRDDGRAIRPGYGRNPAVLRTAPVMITVTSATPNAIIHYTSDGTIPTTNSPTVPSDGNLWISSNMVFSAAAIRHDLAFSTVTQATFNFAVSAPVFSPASGPITNATTVLLSSATPEAVFRYTTNGTDPDSQSAISTGTLTLTGNTELRARGYRDGFTESSVRTAFFSLALIPTLAQQNGQDYLVSWPASVGQAYQLQVSEDLQQWSNSGASVMATGVVMSIVDSNAANLLQKRFYRLVLTNQ